MISFLENNLHASATVCGRRKEVGLCESDDLPIISCICHQVVANCVVCLMSNVTSLVIHTYSFMSCHIMKWKRFHQIDLEENVVRLTNIRYFI